ncbi:ATPase domain-containing protein [Iningainema tapete]|uniref:non-specific serine/threonine protein kinase n=1 Tax=Iningainema tapete BLCC-T55 TaxID=2748662 RepID=A0A8J6XQD0_9CYAN|nr:ATPase domain-containing protein [Iningainema tapete]MBD2776290.1 recombinase RecA [Iningainema tapete BLCC-T55]
MVQHRLSTGVSGLDEVLHGGLLPNRAYLVRGGPGTGKTTLGIHFLAAGVANGETSLYITLGEPAEQIRANAEALNCNAKNIDFLDLSPNAEFFLRVETYDIFSPAEVEREPITQRIIEQVEALKPRRVFVDCMTQFRYLSNDTFLFRKQVLSFIRFILAQEATVLFASESSNTTPDDDLQFIGDGIIHLHHSLTERNICVSKYRGSDFQGGLHPMRLTKTGMEVFPRLQPEVDQKQFVCEAIPSGVPELDQMLHGGLERGTVTLLTGATGAGKTTLGVQFISGAAHRGERSVIYTFAETPESLLFRSESVNIPIKAMRECGILSIIEIPLQLTADEFSRLVQAEVEQKQAKIVMIDSICGYQEALGGKDLVSHLHVLCRYLQNMGVTVLLINDTEYIIGEFRTTEFGISHLVDNIVFLRYLEIQGQMRKAIGVLKKRLSDFEKNLREIEINRYGIKVGKPLEGLRGILNGTPEWNSLV